MYIEKLLNELRSLPDLLIYFFLGLSAFVENLVPPIPGDTITAFGAFLVGMGRLSFAGVYISTTVGSLLVLCASSGSGIPGEAFLHRAGFSIPSGERHYQGRGMVRAYGYFLILFNRFMPVSVPPLLWLQEYPVQNPPVRSSLS